MAARCHPPAIRHKVRHLVATNLTPHQTCIHNSKTRNVTSLPHLLTSNIHSLASATRMPPPEGLRMGRPHSTSSPVVFKINSSHHNPPPSVANPPLNKPQQMPTPLPARRQPKPQTQAVSKARSAPAAFTRSTQAIRKSLPAAATNRQSTTDTRPSFPLPWAVTTPIRSSLRHSKDKTCRPRCSTCRLRVRAAFTPRSILAAQKAALRISSSSSSSSNKRRRMEVIRRTSLINHLSLSLRASRAWRAETLVTFTGSCTNRSDRKAGTGVWEVSSVHSMHTRGS